MVVPDPELDAIASLPPQQLVDLLERLPPTDERLRQLDIDQLAWAIDPRELRPADFVRLLARLEQLASAGTALDLARMSPEAFATLITRATREQIAAMLGGHGLRARILDTIFQRMGQHYRPDRAASVRAVVHWRFPDSDGGYDRFETIMENGRCTASRACTRDARATITLDAPDFVKLITGNASAPMLFMTGKLHVNGDLAFAAGLIGLFDLPRAS